MLCVTSGCIVLWMHCSRGQKCCLPHTHKPAGREPTGREPAGRERAGRERAGRERVDRERAGHNLPTFGSTSLQKLIHSNGKYGEGVPVEVSASRQPPPPEASNPFVVVGEPVRSSGGSAEMSPRMRV